MRFDNRFDVDAPIDRVWDAVLDVERVAPTVPGAQVLERTGEDAYKVAIKVKVGPMSMTYRGEVEITERDEAAHRAVMRARAKESRGQGTANADVEMVLSGEDGRTAAVVTTDVALTGKVASMGRGVLEDVSRRLVQTFAQNLATMLERGEAPEQPVPAQPAAEAPAEPAGAGAESATVSPGGDAQAAGAEKAPRFEVPPAAERPPTDDALDLGAMGGAMLADRLRDPRALGGVLAGIAVVFFWLGRRSAR